MTIHELCVALQSLEPEDDVFVALYVEDAAELFDIEGVRAHQGHAELEIYAEEEVDDEANGNGAVRREPTGAPPDAAEAASGGLSGLLRASRHYGRGERSDLERHGVHLL